MKYEHNPVQSKLSYRSVKFKVYNMYVTYVLNGLYLKMKFALLRSLFSGTVTIKEHSQFLLIFLLQLLTVVTLLVLLMELSPSPPPPLGALPTTVATLAMFLMET